MPAVATETTPLALVFSSPPAALEIVRPVVEAMPVLSIWKSVVVPKVGVEDEITNSVVPVKEEEATNSENFAYGVEVPIPTLPLEPIAKYVVEEPTAKEVVPAAGLMLNCAQGEEVPRPSFPTVESKKKPD